MFQCVNNHNFVTLAILAISISSISRYTACFSSLIIRVELRVSPNRILISTRIQFVLAKMKNKIPSKNMAINFDFFFRAFVSLFHLRLAGSEIIAVYYETF